MTPTTPPGDNNDDDVSKGALPEVCVSLQLSRHKAHTTPTPPGAFYHVGSGQLTIIMHYGRAAYTH